MIDFRYHIVSLISVFLALAVGIVLGAGPLEESIGDTLTGEVDSLRERASDLRTQLDETSLELTRTEDAFAATAPDLLDGVLDGRRVAVIEMGGAAGSTIQQVSERLTQAGAGVTGVVRVTDGWSDAGQRTYRQTLAATLVEYLDPRPAMDAGTTVELAEALAQGLTTAAPDDPEALSEEAGVILELLTEAGLVEMDAAVTQPADAVVLLVGPSADMPEPAEEGETGPTEEELVAVEARMAAATELAVAAQARSGGAVVAAQTLVDDGLIQALRDGSRTGTRISTVTGVDTVIGQVSVSLALSQRISGAVGHYGTDADATAAVPPRVVLAPLEPAVTSDASEASDPSGGEAAAGDPADASTDGETQG